MTVWLEVTQDKYELPVLVALSAGELARRAGVNKTTVSAEASRHARGIHKRTRFLKVDIGDDDE